MENVKDRKIITKADLKIVSEWLEKTGKNELNKLTQVDSETESFIKSMSHIDSEQLKVPYSL